MKQLGMMIMSGGIAAFMAGCDDWPGTGPSNTPDKAWCTLEATQCVLWRTDAFNAPVECLQWRVDPNGVTARVPITPAGGEFNCFNSAEESAQDVCDSRCNSLNFVLHPPVRNALGQIVNAPRCIATVERTEAGECISSSRQPLIALPGPETSPDFQSTLVGSGSLASGGETRNVTVTGGSVSLKAPDPTCANSPAGECRVRVNAVDIRYADFPFRGRSISGLTVFLAAPVDALATPIEGSSDVLFSLLPGTVFHATGLLDGARTNVVVETLSEVTGTYNPVTGVITLGIDFSGTIAGEGVSGSAVVTSDEIVNRPPIADAGDDVTVSAGEACTALVTLDASATTDPDGNLDGLLWSANGQGLGSGVTVQAELPIGQNVVTLHALDAAGAYSFDQVQVTVTDASLPEFVSPPANVDVDSCAPGASSVTLTAPTARNRCGDEPATVTGRVISINGQAVSIPIVDGTATLPAGTSQVEWTATNANGSTTFVQTVEVTSEPTLFASGQLLLGDRVQVLAEGSAFGTAMSTGGDQTRLGNDADVGDLFTLPSVVLLDRSEVHGTLHHGADVQLGNNVVVASTVSDNDFDAPDLPAIPAFQGGEAIHLEPDTTATRAPGSYGDVVVKSRARLVLSPGVYTFTSLQLEPDAILEVPADGSVQIFVRDSITYRGRVLASSGAPAPVLLGYAGSADVKLEAPFWGVALAPNARLVLETAGTDAPGREHRGRFYARLLDVRAGARVLHDDLLCD